MGEETGPDVPSLGPGTASPRGLLLLLTLATLAAARVLVNSPQRNLPPLLGVSPSTSPPPQLGGHLSELVIVLASFGSGGQEHPSICTGMLTHTYKAHSRMHMPTTHACNMHTPITHTHAQAHACTHAHIHTCSHTHAHTCMQTLVHAHTHNTRMHMLMHACTCRHATPRHALPHAQFMHVHIHTWSLTHIHACICPQCSLTYTNSCRHTPINVHTHNTHMHMLVHAHTCRHAHTQTCSPTRTIHACTHADACAHICLLACTHSCMRVPTRVGLE